MAEEKDFYRLLGVSRDAPEREIKKKYYELARKLHPDKARTPEERSANASQLAAISRAYNQLKDPKKRAEYDGQVRGRTVSSDPGAPPPAAARASEPAPAKSAAPAATGGASASAPPPDTSGQSTARKNQLILEHKKTMAQKAFVKGMQHFKRQEFRQALSFFEAAVTNDPESEAQYHLKYAQTLIKLKGSFTKAVEHAERACEIEPYNVEFKMVLADINETAGVTSRAKEIYEEVLRWEPDHTGAKNALGLMQAKSGNSLSNFIAKINGMLSKKK